MYIDVSVFMSHDLKLFAPNSLERLCKTKLVDKMRSSKPVNGVEILQAWFAGPAYDTHRHDTYAIGLTDQGVQSYDYRGAKRTSTPGKVMVLHPDELHNGRAGSDEGFGYRMLYVDPACISDAVRVIVGRPCPLPFVRESVSENKVLAHAIQLVSMCSEKAKETLARDEIILHLANGLIAGDPDCNKLNRKYTINYQAVDRAREYLYHANNRIVHSTELEKVTGLTRYDLSRQFRKVLGTSPYRYSVNRRLDAARQLIQQNKPIVEVAFETGFSDQAHFSRLFKSACGITPGRYAHFLRPATKNAMPTAKRNKIDGSGTSLAV